MSQQHPHLERLDNPGPLRAPRVTAVAAGLVLIGLLGLAAAFLKDPARAWGALLQGMMVPTWISGGALFFIAVNSIGGAHWTVPIRRIMEGLSGGFVLTLVAFLALAIFGMPYLYEWANESAHRTELFHAHDGTKNAWMSDHRVLASTLLILALWIALRGKLVSLSLKQDQRLDMAGRHERWSAFFLVIFALSFTLFVWDLLLSLQVRFVSTAWGLYCFVGSVQTFLAVLCIVAYWLQRGPLKDIIRPHIAKDLGTWMVAWSCIWGYIAYVQYVIIYFANMNEESYFYLMRTQHGYGASYVFEVLLRFPLPFLALMSQRVRNDLKALAVVSALVLLGSWIDLWWMIMPALSPNDFHGFWAWPEVLVGAGFVGAMLLLATRFWNRHGLIAHGDPRLLSAINAEHLH